MKKRDKIIYWIATVWLAAAMVASAIQQIFTIGGFVPIMEKLEYPVYFSIILGIWKLLGVIALLMPKLPLLKEWAYAGFFFVLSGAFISHIAVGNKSMELFVPVFLLIITVLSWYFRPASKKTISK
jgi:hypothetical protein